MKRPTLAAALCVLLATAANAQITRPITFGVAGGVSIPRDFFKYQVDNGFNATALAELKPANSPFGLRIEAGLNQFDTKPYNNHSNTIRSLSLTGNLIAELPLKTFVRGYLIGGAGFYSVQHGLGGIRTYPSSTAGLVDSTVLVSGAGGTLNKLGANLGGGLRFPLWKVEPYIEARANKVAGGYGIRFIPITFGLRF